MPAFVTSEQQADVQFVIETITPLLLESVTQQFALPKHSRLRSFVGPRESLRGGLRHDRVNSFRFLEALAKKDGLTAEPFSAWIGVELIDDCRERARQIDVVAV